MNNIVLSLTLKDYTISNVFFYIHNVEIKGRALMEIYRVVPQTKRGNSWYFESYIQCMTLYFNTFEERT